MECAFVDPFGALVPATDVPPHCGLRFRCVECGFSAHHVAEGAYAAHFRHAFFAPADCPLRADGESGPWDILDWRQSRCTDALIAALQLGASHRLGDHDELDQMAAEVLAVSTRAWRTDSVPLDRIPGANLLELLRTPRRYALLRQILARLRERTARGDLAQAVRTFCLEEVDWRSVWRTVLREDKALPAFRRMACAPVLALEELRFDSKTAAPDGHEYHPRINVVFASPSGLHAVHASAGEGTRVFTPRHDDSVELDEFSALVAFRPSASGSVTVPWLMVRYVDPGAHLSPQWLPDRLPAAAPNHDSPNMANVRELCTTDEAGRRHGSYELHVLERAYDGERWLVRQTGSYEHGSRSGLWRTLYKNGRTEWVGEFAANGETGIWVRFDDRGNIMSAQKCSAGGSKPVSVDDPSVVAALRRWKLTR